MRSGDMDFKVTGTAKGITGCQMDIKIDGLPYEMLGESTYPGKEGKASHIGRNEQSLAEPRARLSLTHQNGRDCNRQSFIGAVIGPGGKRSFRTFKHVRALLST